MSSSSSSNCNPLLRIFDADFYKDAYPDIRPLSDSDATKHWYKYGCAENRIPSMIELYRCLPDNFDVEHYLEIYSDVNIAVGGHRVRAMIHYCTHGKQEGRQYKEEDIVIVDEYGNETDWHINTTENEMLIEHEGVPVSAFFTVDS